MKRHELGQQTQRMLRVVPSDDTITPMEVTERLGMSPQAVHQMMSRAVRRGHLVRLRMGAYQRVTP